MISTLPRRVIAALGIGAALALTATASFAATAPRGGSANPPASQSENRDRDSRDLRAYVPPRDGQRGDRLERRLAFLHRQLDIRANQEGAWSAFANAIRNEARTTRDRLDQTRERFRDRRDNDRDGARRAGQRGDSVVARLERRREQLANENQWVENLLSAVQPLYAALDQNQRRTADRLFFRNGMEQRFRYFERRFRSFGFGDGLGGRPFRFGFQEFRNGDSDRDGDLGRLGFDSDSDFDSADSDFNSEDSYDSDRDGGDEDGSL